MIAVMLASLLTTATAPVGGYSVVHWGRIVRMASPPRFGGDEIDIFAVTQREAKPIWLARRRNITEGTPWPHVVDWIDGRSCKALSSILKDTSKLNKKPRSADPPVFDGMSLSVVTLTTYPSLKQGDGVRSHGNVRGQTDLWMQRELPKIASCWTKQIPEEAKIISADD